MVSLGLGLRKSSLEQIEESGGLTTIEVNNYNYGGGYAIASSSDSSDSNEPQRIDDAVVADMANIPHVELASPILEMSVLAKQGAYEGLIQIRGMSAEMLRKLDLDVGEGEIPPDDGVLQLFYGNTVITDFYNAKTNEYYWETQVLPDVDLMNDPVFIIFDTDAYYSSQYPDENGQNVPPPKKYIIPTCGIMAGGVDAVSYTHLRAHET